MPPKLHFYLKNMMIFIPLVFVGSMVLDYMMVFMGLETLTGRQILEEGIFKGLFLGGALGIITSIGKFGQDT